MCSTKIDENGNHVIEDGCFGDPVSDECYNIGFCGPNCPLETRGDKIKDDKITAC